MPMNALLRNSMIRSVISSNRSASVSTLVPGIATWGNWIGAHSMLEASITRRRKSTGRVAAVT